MGVRELCCDHLHRHTEIVSAGIPHNRGIYVQMIWICCLGLRGQVALRLGQAVFAVASLLFMCFDVEFYSYTAFCVSAHNFLVTTMALVIPWSLTLAAVDIFSLLIKRTSRQPGILSIVVIRDWVLSFLALAASCSTASVMSILFGFGGSFCRQKICTRYQLSAAMACLSWFLILASSLFNLWLLPATL